MLKKLSLTFFIIFIFFGIAYPSKKENTKIFNYCYALEIIIFKNSLESKKKNSDNLGFISHDIAEFGVSKTKGKLINKIINQYKKSKNYLIINIWPNEVYCFSGYWLENLKPGIIEFIFYEHSKKRINKLKDLRHEIDGFLKEINLEYGNMKKGFSNIFFE